MKLIKTSLQGAMLVELEKKEDDRGFFARTWDIDVFGKAGLKTAFVQANMSHTLKKGTLRGLHFQRSPHAEAKLIRVTRGAIYDVIIDLRKQSPTYKQWYGIELSEENCTAIFVPEGFAHGFVTLKDNTEVSYFVTAFYTPEADTGIRYNDPAFNILWPIPITSVSDKDASFPDYREEQL
jgi:dTDP-4-dehydrorhamnose 3,5-epimerase